MKNHALLDDVLAGDAGLDGSLGPVLRAARARRARRQVPAMMATAAGIAVLIAWLWPMRTAEVATRALPESPVPAAKVVEIVRTRPDAAARISSTPLPPEIRLSTAAAGPGLAASYRVKTGAETVARLTREELFTVAGGKGLALAKMADGRMELLFAHAP